MKGSYKVAHPSELLYSALRTEFRRKTNQMKESDPKWRKPWK